jgi:hypothetical protein
VPLFPFRGAAWLVVGVQEQTLAEVTAALLLGQQDQDAAVEQGLVLAAWWPSSRSGRGRQATPRHGPDYAGQTSSSPVSAGRRRCDGHRRPTDPGWWG